MSPYKRLALISIITLVGLGCLRAGAWLVCERRAGKEPVLTSMRRVSSEAGQRAGQYAPLSKDSRPAAAERRRLVQSYGGIPLSFERNAGQTDARVKFLSRGPGYTLFLTGNEAVLALKKSGVRSQESEAGRSKLEIGNWKFENRSSKIGNRQSKLPLAFLVRLFPT